ncbi:MAG: acetylglutamate kinase [Deltaproteobacteria bacterium]|nr:acetylglutamate kinase [Deltaproteobacteria bacterium]MBK8720343.1 acetylglutamate kinase [Deltaproteobacteria bacterium]MBP7290594.1 acetylglutamate kinase [Nannocystaceae bacterium]
MSASALRVVVKFGGEVVARPAELSGLLAEVAKLRRDGAAVVLCHGGGPQASALQQRLGVETVKVGGRRITDAATLQIMKCVLAGEVSIDVVAAALAAGVPAVGLSGVSAGLVTAHRRPPKRVSGGGEAPVDFGLVGDIDTIRTELLEQLWRGGFVPVVNSLGVAAQAEPGQPCAVFNINADTVAAAVAAALRADHLLLITDVPGVLRDREDPSSVIPTLTRSAARQAIADGIIAGGMIPKVEEALDNLAQGIGAVHILGAGALHDAVRSPGARGTVLVEDGGHP